MFRFPNVIGERLVHGVIFYKKIKNDPKELQILEDGNQEKLYIYVKDLVEAIIFVFKKSHRGINYFNIGTEVTSITIDKYMYIVTNKRREKIMSINSLISVIMPVYNGEKYLKESIESIMNQTYKNFEFIIINDGSTDNSLNIINEYAERDSRIKVISRENKGISYSLNEGISASKGEYIARMDADDICMPERFDEQLKVMTNNNIHICATHIEIIGNITTEEKLSYEHTHNLDKLTIIELVKGYTICHPTVLFRKKILDTLKGYNEDYNTTEDIELWFRAIKEEFNFYVLNKKLLKYRRHSDSKTSKEGDICFVNFVNIRLDFIKDKLNKGEFKYLIWGASNGGVLCKNLIKKRFPQADLVAYVDTYKTGFLEDINIVSPKIINKFKFDYIFIATTPGKDAAFQYLNSLGLTCIKDYISLY
ncbi:glycosyltransferase [Clostridium botulinum]|uniref:glycosyltransferase n=1 Tax=Clostridium botulinum TaxID=1491 RepID=UPI00241D3110|nr:glycosyltransferase [Clostridium botulinum]